MTRGWTVDIGTGGGALTTYESALPVYFLKRLNGVGNFTLYVMQLDGHAAIARDMLVRIFWNKGESDEKLHIEGFVTDVREDSGRQAYWVRGLTLEGLMAQSTLGTTRKYTAQTPHTIIQSAGSPRGLIYNSQNNLKPVGGTTVRYGSSASVPLKVDGANPGTALTFLADSSRSMLNIQRLCLQARYDGASYGLEWFVRLEGASNSDPYLYLVKRRNRAAVYTAETWTINSDLLRSRRGTEGLTAAQLIRVVGLGDGTSRVDSGAVGAGGLEGIIADKSIIDATAATNMANRLSELLNPSTEMVTAYLAKYAHTSELGDDVTIAQNGRANVTLRLFEVSWNYQEKLFSVVLGRPRANPHDPLAALDKLAGSQAHAPQVTDTVPEVIESSTPSITATSGGVAVAAGAGPVPVAISAAPAADFGRAEAFWIHLSLGISAGTVAGAASHTHDLGNHTHTYDKTTGVTISNANSGNAGADPHGHTATPTHTATASGTPSTNISGASAPAVSLQGPLVVRVYVRFASGNEVNLALITLPPLQVGGAFISDTRTYPFAVADGTDYSPTSVRIGVTNLGPYNVTIAAGSQVTVYKNALHRHNAT